MATVELAAAIPALVIMVLVCVAAISVAQLRVRCADAAREAARAVARGDPAAAPRLAAAAAGRSARIATSASDALQTRVTVTIQLRPVSWLGAFELTESAVVATEPDTAGPTP
jgi:Flp pilus assembly protein TadG